MEKYKLKHRKSFRTKKEKSILKKRGFWFSLFFLIIFGTGIYYAFHYRIFEIKEILILGNQKIKTEEIKSLIEEKIRHKILFIETKNVFLADVKNIEEAILAKFPRIRKINVNKDWAGILSAEIVERRPSGTLCNSSDCYLFDKEGIVFDVSAEEEMISIKIEPQDYRLNLGKQEISKEMAEGIMKIDRILRDNFSIEPEEITLSFNRETLEIGTSEGWKIYFKSQGDIESQILNLDLLLKEEISGKDRKNLDYIDLRYGNKIFYKKK